MRKLFFITLVALTVASCKSKGVRLEVLNHSGGDITNVLCYTVISGDTLLTQDLVKDGKNASVSFDKKEGKTDYNFILEFVRDNGFKDTSIESITLTKESRIATVRFTIDEASIQADYDVK
ncbi:MAG: hypothetical protein ACK5MI_01770 [Mangrovibacterium sp.]